VGDGGGCEMGLEGEGWVGFEGVIKGGGWLFGWLFGWFFEGILMGGWVWGLGG